MPYKPREVEARLRDKFGFSEAATKSDDHRWFELVLPDLPPIRTKVSHSRQPISAQVEAMIARQLRVRNPFFRGMMDCHNSSADYRRQIHDDPYPPFEHIVV